jgi:hypothetical protein
MPRCVGCHVSLAGFGKRARRKVDVCDYCLRIARHDEDAIARFRRQEHAVDFDVAYLRTRVRSAIHYAWLRSHGLLYAQREAASR